jgi:hypothetical protein
MEARALEIRDRHTFIPAMALRPTPGLEAERYLWARAGFTEGDGLVLLLRLGDMTCTYDPFAWGNRTMQEAHRYVTAKFDQLKDGQVVDVAFLLGERTAPCPSERLA